MAPIGSRQSFNLLVQRQRSIPAFNRPDELVVISIACQVRKREIKLCARNNGRRASWQALGACALHSDLRPPTSCQPGLAMSSH